MRPTRIAKAPTSAIAGGVELPVGSRAESLQFASRLVKYEARETLPVVTCSVAFPGVISQDMGDSKGHPVMVPVWWIEMLLDLIGRHRGARADLAAKIAKSEDRNSDVFKAAKTLVTRFLNGKHRTLETVAEIRALYPELPQVVFVPSTKKEADRFAEVATGDERAMVADLSAIEALIDARIKEATLRPRRSRGRPRLKTRRPTAQKKSDA